MKKIPVGILGATGMVGQRFVTLLRNHPWFDVTVVAASPRSAGKSYQEAVKGRWVMKEPIPTKIARLTVYAVEKDLKKIASHVRLIFSALEMEKEKIKEIENKFALLNVAVVSNTSAHRWTKDVPMVIPEINPDHLSLIKVQQKHHGWKKGFIVVKPNCSIQSYVPLLTALWQFKPQKVLVTTQQALSGAGKTFAMWPEMEDNVIPYIGGEEEKSEKEPMKIWGKVANGKVQLATSPTISATCVRVPVSDGHMATVAVSFVKKTTAAQIIKAWKTLRSPIEKLNLPSAPKPFITVFEEDDRPQTSLDRNIGNGMGIAVGRLRKDSILDWKFAGLSHNTIRGAAGGAVLTAELLKAKGYI